MVLERRVEFETSGEPMPGFLARPEPARPAPAVVVVQEWWGLNRQIESVARRVADAGFDTLVPDLYRGAKADEPDDARKLAMELDRPRALEDIRAAVTWLLMQSAPAVGAIGFCMGAGIVWELARSDDRPAAVVPCYGGVDFREGGPVLVPFQAHYGTGDRFPREMYGAIEAHRADAPGSELHLYEGAGHAFMNEEGSSFSPEDAALAWDRVIAFFSRRLGSSVRP